MKNIKLKDKKMILNAFEVAKTKNGYVGKKSFYKGVSGTLFSKNNYVLVYSGADLYIAEILKITLSPNFKKIGYYFLTSFEIIRKYFRFVKGRK